MSLFQVDKYVTPVQSPSTSLNISFGFEFDAADLSQFDKIVEKHIQRDPAPQSPLAVPSKDASQGNVTPQGTGQALTPQLGNRKRSGFVVNKFGCTRERISTPIEDSEHMPLFSSTHSPVFSPVTGAFQQFENSNGSQARRIRFDDNTKYVARHLVDNTNNNISRTGLGF